MCCSSCSTQTETGKCLYYMGDIMVLSAERQTCDQEVMGLNLSWAHSVNIMGKFLTSMCLWHQAVQVGTGLTAVTPEGWEGNCRPGGKYHQVHDYACCHQQADRSAPFPNTRPTSVGLPLPFLYFVWIYGKRERKKSIWNNKQMLNYITVIVLTHRHCQRTYRCTLIARIANQFVSL